MMEKDFTEWHGVKTNLQRRDSSLFFREREVWFCSLGMNLGREEDGKRELFLRPVLIFRKFSADLFWGIPLTSTFNTGSYYYRLDFKGRTSIALLFQMRLLDRKRLLRKIRTLSGEEFAILKEQLKDLLIHENETPPQGRGISEAEAKCTSSIAGSDGLSNETTPPPPV